MTILRTQIETAMDELISNEEGIQKDVPGEHLATSGFAEEEVDNLSALLAAGMN